MSIPPNIAEGQGRGTSGEFDRFLRIANGSRQEVETQMLIAERLGYVDQKLLQPTLALGEEVGRIIAGLRGALARS